MMFGEIVEPSTRALMFEDDDIINEELDWQIETEVPSTVESILISDKPFTNKILQTVFLSDKNCVAQTKNKVISIYKFESSKYILLCNPTQNSSIGHITGEILPWINAASQCYTLTTSPITSYLMANSSERPFVILRMLSTSNESTICPRLETPNVAVGVGANCLSYCLFNEKYCSLFIGYIEHAPIDSLNSQPFIDLLKQIGYDSHGKVSKLVDKLPMSNLYI